MNRLRYCVRNYKRQVMFAPTCDFLGLLPVESIPDEVVLVPRGVSRFTCGNGKQCGTDLVESLGIPRPEVVEAPLDARIGASVTPSRVGEVGKVRVFQQVNPPKRRCRKSSDPAATATMY